MAVVSAELVAWSRKTFGPTVAYCISQDADARANFVGRAANPNMKICHITTYWPTCNYGHTHYTENLMRGMRLHRPEKHYVLGAYPAAAVDNDEYQCIPCFRVGRDYVDDIAAAAQQVRPDVAIIQHSPDLFGHDNRLPRLVAKLKAMGIAPVVNSHSIYAASSRSAYQPGGTAADFDRALAEHVA